MESSLLIRLLEQVQYNHGAVHESDYGEIVPDYMKALDSQHLFFLESDRKAFMAKYDAKTVYANLAYLGNIDPAYDIYNLYSQRLQDRVKWVLAQLAAGVNLTTTDTFAVDRSKAEWPASPEECDALWSKRLRFELITEILDKKTPEQAKAALKKRYERLIKNMAQTTTDDLAETYLTTVTQLYDPHSNYFSADDYADFGIQMKLHLIGIGAVLELKDDYCTIREIVPGSPAYLTHQIQPDDRIISVAQDGKEPVDIVGMPRLRDIVNMIRGEKGTKVHLVIEHPGIQGRKEVVIVRDDVKLNSARAHGGVFQVPDASGKAIPIGVITLPEFYGPADDESLEDQNTSASKDVARLIVDMKQVGVKGIVLDLRNNGGGFLAEAINVAGLFIPPHGAVVQVRDSDGNVQVQSDDDKRVLWDGPLAVLENRLSASASEIVAGALQNYGRAIIIGDTSTHGKGTVQTILDMKSINRSLAYSSAKTGAAKITVQKFYLPNGSSTQLDGVKSDITLPTIDDYLPLGESTLPHALIWDRIPSTIFDGHALDPKVVDALRADSLERQHTLEEFAYLRRNVDWFKSKEEQKLISLNLDERGKQKALDDAFRKEMKAERNKLAKDDYPFQEFRVAPKPPPLVKAHHDDDDDDEDELSPDDDESATPYKVDVELREALRVIDDAIGLGRDRSYWAFNHAPLTVASTYTAAETPR
jgi:carboxyl-terminal processing protease